MSETIYQVLDRIQEREEASELDLKADCTPFELLQAVYQDAAQPLSRRIRCAVAAMPFVHPKLSVIASLGPNHRFADKLERAMRIARGEALIIDGVSERITPGAEG